MLKLYNTLTRKKENFKPIKKGRVGMYTCGPTVYNYAHIGNLRTYVFEDILKRVLMYNGLNVQHVMNITDVGHLTSDADYGEDKIDLSSKREGKTPQEIANFYTNAFKDDISKLNIIGPEIWCKATDHIHEQINLIKRLEEKGYTYIGKSGNVYFDTSKFKKYGKMARLDLKQEARSRVQEDLEKKNSRDFVLWFSLRGSKFKGHILRWPSPWGEGFPGWHIECSAMSMKYLGEKFDIHCSGIDHIPVHHTNEIAQSEAATGKKWVNYWIHSNFLVFASLKDEKQEKMSKSSGGFITLKNLIDKGYEPLVYRYFCLTTHHRNELLFSWQNLDSSKNTFNTLKNKVLEIKGNLARREICNDKISKYKEKFLKIINDDLNMPKALALFWQMLRDSELSNNEKYALILDFDQVFGLNLDNIKPEKLEIPFDIRELLKRREIARRNKDFELSDDLRDRIKARGWQVDDTLEGQKVKKI
jgi:cysteinyl-tRNA synthetase